MLAHAIETAKSSNLFDRILVSTDDEEIAQVAYETGSEKPILRPPELSDDLTPTVPVIAHAIQKTISPIDQKTAIVCCIYPCTPLLQTSDLKNGLECLLQRPTEGYAFPVVQFQSPIQRALKKSADGKVTPFYPEFVNTRTQDLEPTYHDAGQFYWGQSAAWTRGLHIHSHASCILLPTWRAIDIDTPDDWLHAEAIYQTFKLQEGH